MSSTLPLSNTFGPLAKLGGKLPTTKSTKKIDKTTTSAPVAFQDQQFSFKLQPSDLPIMIQKAIEGINIQLKTAKPGQFPNAERSLALLDIFSKLPPGPIQDSKTQTTIATLLKDKTGNWDLNSQLPHLFFLLNQFHLSAPVATEQPKASTPKPPATSTSTTISTSGPSFKGLLKAGIFGAMTAAAAAIDSNVTVQCTHPNGTTHSIQQQPITMSWEATCPKDTSMSALYDQVADSPSISFLGRLKNPESPVQNFTNWVLNSLSIQSGHFAEVYPILYTSGQDTVCNHMKKNKQYLTDLSCIGSETNATDVYIQINPKNISIQTAQNGFAVILPTELLKPNISYFLNANNRHDENPIYLSINPKAPPTSICPPKDSPDRPHLSKTTLIIISVLIGLSLLEIACIGGSKTVKYLKKRNIHQKNKNLDEAELKKALDTLLTQAPQTPIDSIVLDSCTPPHAHDKNRFQKFKPKQKDSSTGGDPRYKFDRPLRVPYFHIPPQKSTSSSSSSSTACTAPSKAAKIPKHMEEVQIGTHCSVSKKPFPYPTEFTPLTPRQKIIANDALKGLNEQGRETKSLLNPEEKKSDEV